jgi:restriction endonuclease S subunit
MAFQLSDAVNKDKVFLVKQSELDVRLDPVFYKPEYRDNESHIKNCAWGYDSVAQIAKRIADGPFGSDLKVEEYQPEGIPLLRVTNLKTGEIDGDLVFISPQKHKQLKRSCVYPNDVVLTKAGSIGFSVVFPENLTEANITSHLVTITCRDDIKPQYLSWYFKSRVGLLQIYRWGNKTTRPELNTGEVEKILVTTPPPETQSQIVTQMNSAYAAKKYKEAQAQQLLDSIDTYLLHELGIELPAEEENSISQRMFVRKFSEVSGGRFDTEYFKEDYVRHEKAVNAGKFKIRKLADFIISIAYGASVNNEYEVTGIPLLRIKDLLPNEINSESTVFLPESMRKEIGNAFVKSGNFLISRSGSLGITAIVDEAHDGYAFGSFMIKFAILDNDVSKPFISYVLNSQLGKTYFKRNRIGAIQGNITIPVIKSCPLPLPPLEKQNEIAAHIQAIRDQAKQLRAEAAAGLEQAKQEVEAMILGGTQ